MFRFRYFKKFQLKATTNIPSNAALTHSSVAVQGSSEASFVKKMAFRILGGINKKATDISWNFEKFLVDRSGKVVARFSPTVKPEEAALTAAIEKLLKS